MTKHYCDVCKKEFQGDRLETWELSRVSLRTKFKLLERHLCGGCREIVLKAIKGLFDAEASE